MRSRILLLPTGGTIASLPTEEGLAPGLDGADLAEMLPRGMTDAYDLTIRDILHLDSSNIQPEEWQSWDMRSPAIVRRLAQSPKCVAIGEIGLDYYWDREHKELMYEMFVTQLELALELGKPVIIHDRDAHADCLAIVKRYPGLRGVFHCYSGSAEMARELLSLGWHLGFDGPITYKNARKALEVLEICPLERILLETDSPYLPPVPFRGKRNDSTKLSFIAEKVAEVKGLSAAEVARATCENARRLFGI